MSKLFLAYILFLVIELKVQNPHRSSTSLFGSLFLLLKHPADSSWGLQRPKDSNFLNNVCTMYTLVESRNFSYTNLNTSVKQW